MDYSSAPCFQLQVTVLAILPLLRGDPVEEYQITMSRFKRVPIHCAIMDYLSAPCFQLQVTVLAILPLLMGDPVEVYQITMSRFK